MNEDKSLTHYELDCLRDVLKYYHSVNEISYKELIEQLGLIQYKDKILNFIYKTTYPNDVLFTYELKELLQVRFAALFRQGHNIQDTPVLRSYTKLYGEIVQRNEPLEPLQEARDTAQAVANLQMQNAGVDSIANPVKLLEENFPKFIYGLAEKYVGTSKPHFKTALRLLNGRYIYYRAMSRDTIMRAEMVIQERRPLDPEAPIIEVFKNLDNGPHCEGLIIPLSKNYFGLMTQVIGNRRLLSIVIDTMNARQPAVLSGELMIADERVLTTRFLCYRIGEADDESLDPGDVYYRDDIHVDEFLNENDPFFIAKTGQRYSSYEISQEIGVDP